GTIETAVKAIKMGAVDLLEKPLSIDQVLLTARNVLDMTQLKSENRRLRQTIESKYEIIGRSEAVSDLKAQVERAAPSDSRVLITGENGTGKELVAQQIHLHSNRRDKPFIEVNCAALPEQLIESELFGHEKGAFTGAVSKKRGKFDLADGGTIFLDEIGDMDLTTQAKILRILQEQKFERVGGTESITVDVRVIAATNRDLEGMIKDGAFREDLYFRLNVIPLHIVPLRQRREDIPLLIDYFIEHFCTRSALPTKQFAEDAVKLMTEYNWPGNVRELKNIVERLVIMTPKSTVTGADVRGALKPGAAGETELEGVMAQSDWKEAKAEFERAFLVRKLTENQGNVSRTAEAIGVERSHLHRRIKALGIDPEKVS
ncbi:sigma-54-dependent Fis family transcriptional regulator, partial [bacterium]|nr:sigma-54-dependent Fis family transcriptional regulator [bacterium]